MCNQYFIIFLNILYLVGDQCDVLNIYILYVFIIIIILFFLIGAQINYCDSAFIYSYHNILLECDNYRL